MAVKEESHSEHNAIHVSGDGAAMKAERLAPLEEMVRRSSPGNQSAKDALNDDDASLKLPAHLGEEKKYRLFGIEPITFFIMVFALVFIAFVAYLISIEAPKDKEEPAPAVIEQRP